MSISNRPPNPDDYQKSEKPPERIQAENVDGVVQPAQKKKRAGPHLNKQQRKQLLKYAWEKRVKFAWTQDRIVQGFIDEFGLEVHQSTVSRALNRRSNQIDLEIEALKRRHKVEQFYILQFLAEEALEQWQKSKQPRKAVHQRKYVRTTTETPMQLTEDGDMTPSGPDIVQIADEHTTTTTNVTEALPNPAFLNEVRSALADIRTLMGMAGDTLDGELIIRVEREPMKPKTQMNADSELKSLQGGTE